MESSQNEFKFLALIDREDAYYHEIINLILKHNATIVNKDEMDTGVEFLLKFQSEEKKNEFAGALFPKDSAYLTAV